MDWVPNLKFKTELCESWKNKIPCEKKGHCHFAHGEDKLRTLQQNQVEIARRNSQLPPHQKIVTNFKTSYCKFNSSGQCKLGANCTFAHSKREKRSKASPAPEPVSGPPMPHLNPFFGFQQPNYAPYQAWMLMNQTQYQIPLLPYFPFVPNFSPNEHNFQQFNEVIDLNYSPSSNLNSSLNTSAQVCQNEHALSDSTSDCNEEKLSLRTSGNDKILEGKQVEATDVVERSVQTEDPFVAPSL